MFGGCAPRPGEPAAPVAHAAEPAAVAAEERCEARGDDGAIVLAFGGDVIAHEAIRASAARADERDADGGTKNHAGYGAMLAAARASLRDADFAFVNLESPVTERQARRGPMIFHAEEAMLGALAEAGVGVVSVANNHAYDQGTKGLVDTLDAASRHGLVVVGAGATSAEACRPRLFEVKGIRVALFARAQLLNFQADESPARGAHVCMLQLGPLKRDVKAARAAGADLVAVSLHWGNEYDSAPRREQVDVARMIVDAGADLLIGHHPHVLQRVERMSVRGREAVVAYSLGNLLSNQAYDYEPDANARRGDPRDVAVLRVVVEKAPQGVRVRDVTAVPLWTEHTDETISLVPATTRRARIAERLGIPLVDPAPEDPPCALR